MAALDEIDTVIKAYQLYLEQLQSQDLEPLLSLTRAWRLVKFVDNGMLTMTRCSKCGGHFVTHPHEIARHYVCGLCNPPARAGKGKPAVQRPLDAGLDLADAPLPGLLGKNRPVATMAAGVH